MYLCGDCIHFLATIIRLRWFLWLSCIVHLVTGFTLNESLPVYSNKAYSIYSPLETYDYYVKFPFCQPNKTSSQGISILDNIKGNVYSISPYTINYLQPINDADICNVNLTPSDIQQLKYDIDEGYIYELVIDHITLKLPFGYHQNEAYHVPTKIHFRMVFNNGTILSKSFVQIEDSLVLPDTKKENVTLSLSYSVSWMNKPDYIEKPLIDGETPFKLLSQNNIRRLGVTNSFLLALLFFSIVFILIFFLMRSDLRNYIQCPDEERGIPEETHGWKVLYGDIMRPPRHRNFFCACVAAGIQIFLMLLALMRLVLVPNIRNEKEAVTFVGAMFILASVLAAYIASFLYRRVSGTQWKYNILTSIFVFMGPCWVVCIGTNFIAQNYQSSRHIPNFIVFKAFYLWLLILFPILVVSCILGRYHAAEMISKTSNLYQKTSRLAREIPRCSWKKSPWCHICIAGFISFLTAGIDFHVILSTLWGNAQDINFTAAFSTLFVNLIITGSLSLLINYYHLNKEDYRWHWRSFFSGGFLALYQTAYTLFFALNSSDDSSFLQLALFLSYSLLFAWAVFLVFGCVTFFLNYLFVLYIYSTTRFD